MICPDCQAENRAERHFCRACAAKLVPLVCPRCAFVNQCAVWWTGCNTSLKEETCNDSTDPGTLHPSKSIHQSTIAQGLESPLQNVRTLKIELFAFQSGICIFPTRLSESGFPFWGRHR